MTLSAPVESRSMTDGPDAARLRDAVAVCRDMITKGSKSFSLAARLFAREERDAAFCLYGWCRACDDIADGSDLGRWNGPDRATTADRLARIEALVDQTRRAYAGESMDDPVWVAFQHVVRRYEIPMDYPLELLRGMAMDARRERFPTINDLLLYCHRVAGVVGLMMSHIMGVSDEDALRHADGLGKAMQLTNIARDVAEDAAMGRVYVPLDWLQEFGIPPDEIADPRHRVGLHRVVKRVLAVAEVYYLSGDRGLRFLPFRASCAVAGARRVYAEIGRLVASRGAAAWDDRAIAPFPAKLRALAAGVAQAAATLPARMRRPWRRAPIHTIWRHKP